MPNASPAFRSPPVIERVLGVQFDPLSGLTNAHLGAFWSTLGTDWPLVADAPPLPPEFERFGSEQMWAPLGLVRFGVTGKPAVRVQARNPKSDRMVQFQNGRFHYNCMGPGGNDYVRYDAIREEFKSRFAQFEQFVEQNGLGRVHANQWEITYVNHLPADTVWSRPADWEKLFATTVTLPMKLHKAALESFSGQWHYEIEANRGRLHVEIQHGRTEEEGAGPRDVLIMKLTARGPILSENGWGLFDGLDIGHDVIVNGFVRLTSETARTFWEQEA